MREKPRIKPQTKQQLTEYQTQQSRRVACQPRKNPCMLPLEVPFSSNGSGCVFRKVIVALVVGLPAFAVAGWAQLAPSPDAAPVSNCSRPGA